MRRAAQANWSRLPNHNLPHFYTTWTRSGHGGTALLVTSSADTMAARRRCSAVSAVPRPRSGREALADSWKSRAGFGLALAIDGGVENFAERAACN
jgi:hypothetical protein